MDPEAAAAAAAHVHSRSSTGPGWRGSRPAGTPPLRANRSTARRQERRGTPAGAVITLMSWEREQEALLGPERRWKCHWLQTVGWRRWRTLRAAACHPCFLIRNSCIQRFCQTWPSHGFFQLCCTPVSEWIQSVSASAVLLDTSVTFNLAATLH